MLYNLAIRSPVSLVTKPIRLATIDIFFSFFNVISPNEKMFYIFTPYISPAWQENTIWRWLTLILYLYLSKFANCTCHIMYIITVGKESEESHFHSKANTLPIKTTILGVKLHTTLFKTKIPGTRILNRKSSFVEQLLMNNKRKWEGK